MHMYVFVVACDVVGSAALATTRLLAAARSRAAAFATTIVCCWLARLRAPLPANSIRFNRGRYKLLIPLIYVLTTRIILSSAIIFMHKHIRVCICGC